MEANGRWSGDEDCWICDCVTGERDGKITDSDGCIRICDCVAGEQDGELTESDGSIWICDCVAGERDGELTDSDAWIWICDCVAGSWSWGGIVPLMKLFTAAMKPSTDEKFSLMIDLFNSYALVDNKILPFSQWN